MPKNVKYTAPTGVHRPYLEVVFCNSVSGRCGPKSFGLLDSGADGSVIPYSLGKQLGLQPPMAHELSHPNIMGGIGGEAWHVHRECQIHMLDTKTGADLLFNESVSWIYPDPATYTKLKELEKKYEQLRHENDVAELAKVEAEIQNKNKNLEPEILLGRPFFDNFKYLTFFHHDRRREHECSFEFEINPNKIIESNKSVTPHV